MADLIDRQAAIDALNKEIIKRRILGEDDYDGMLDEFDTEDILKKVPSTQPEQDREFIKLAVRNSNGRPYYSIIYLEFDDNDVGHDFEGYSSYSLDVISDYLKKYFMTSAQPERKKGRWINDVAFYDEEGCPCIVTRCDQCGEPGTGRYCSYCGADMRGERDE